MNDLILNGAKEFWDNISAITSLFNTFIISITAFFIYGQVKMGVRAFQFSSILKMQELVDSFKEDRKIIFSTFPYELILNSSQFPSHPPSGFSIQNISEGERRKLILSKKQINALNNLSNEQLELARKVISKLNDIGQLLEDGFLNYKVFLGKYHTMVIRLCHILEPIRRKIEEEGHGGSFGQRLLRMRHKAIIYNTIIPKQRNVDLKIVIQNKSIIIVPALKGTFSQKLFWFLKRRFFHY